jgi:hypothetical protein
MSKGKPDYTKFMKKPAQLDARFQPYERSVDPKAADEIPWAEVIPETDSAQPTVQLIPAPAAGPPSKDPETQEEVPGAAAKDDSAVDEPAGRSVDEPISSPPPWAPPIPLFPVSVLLGLLGILAIILE